MERGKKHSGRGRRAFECRPRQGGLKKGDAEERRWMKREQDLAGRRCRQTWIECMCLLRQLITLHRGHGLAPHTHTPSSGKGGDVSSNRDLSFKVWMNLIAPFLRQQPVWACVVQISSGENERLISTPRSLIVNAAALQSVTGFSVSGVRRLGLYTRTPHGCGARVTTCSCVHVG